MDKVALVGLKSPTTKLDTDSVKVIVTAIGDELVSAGAVELKLTPG